MRAILLVLVGAATLACSTAAMKTSPPLPNALVTTQEQTLRPTDADWDWVGQHYQETYETLMPMDNDSLVVGYLAKHDNDPAVMERYFGIDNRKGIDGATVVRGATVVVPLERAITAQLLQLHMSDRTVAYEAVLSRIKVRRMSFTEETCPAIERQLGRMADVRVSLPDFGVIYLPIHRVWHRVVTSTVDATVGDPKSELAQWATRTFDAFWGCGLKKEQ